MVGYTGNWEVDLRKTVFKFKEKKDWAKYIWKKLRKEKVLKKLRKEKLLKKFKNFQTCLKYWRDGPVVKVLAVADILETQLREGRERCWLTNLAN